MRSLLHNSQVKWGRNEACCNVVVFEAALQACTACANGSAQVYAWQDVQASAACLA